MEGLGYKFEEILGRVIGFVEGDDIGIYKHGI